LRKKLLLFKRVFISRVLVTRPACISRRYRIVYALYVTYYDVPGILVDNGRKKLKTKGTTLLGYYVNSFNRTGRARIT